jgi:FtsZ-interacting cell division protein YlmF
MTTKTYTFEELKQFIRSKDDDKLVNMHQSADYTVAAGDTYCGCVLVQFFRKKFKNKVLYVGYTTGSLLKNKKRYEVLNETDKDAQYKFIAKLVSMKPKTYKEVKQILNQFS